MKTDDMIFNSKLSKQGSGVGLYVPSWVIKSRKLEIGDEVIVIIKKSAKKPGK